MKRLFGYVWFRISKVYRRDDKIGITGSGFLAFAQALLLVEVAIPILRFFYGPDSVQLMARELSYITIGIMLLLAVVNHGLYSQKYDFYYARWQQETKVESAIKGILVLMFLLLPIFIAIINIDIDVK